MLSVIKKNVLKVFFVALITSSTIFAQSGLELGLFVPIGASISIHQYDRDYFNSDDAYERHTTNNARNTSLAFEAGVLAHVGYRFAFGKNNSFSLLGEIGYNRDVFSFALKDSNTNSYVRRLKNFKNYTFDSIVLGVLPKFNFGKFSLGVGGGVKIPLFAYIGDATYSPFLSYVNEDASIIKPDKLSDYFETPIIPYIKVVFDTAVFSSESIDLVLSGYVGYDFAINYTNKTVENFGPKQSLSSVDVGIQLGAKIKPMAFKGKK